MERSGGGEQQEEAEARRRHDLPAAADEAAAEAALPSGEAVGGPCAPGAALRGEQPHAHALERWSSSSTVATTTATGSLFVPEAAAAAALPSAFGQQQQQPQQQPPARPPRRSSMHGTVSELCRAATGSNSNFANAATFSRHGSQLLPGWHDGGGGGGGGAGGGGGHLSGLRAASSSGAGAFLGAGRGASFSSLTGGGGGSGMLMLAGGGGGGSGSMTGINPAALAALRRAYGGSGGGGSACGEGEEEEEHELVEEDPLPSQLDDDFGIAEAAGASDVDTDDGDDGEDGDDPTTRHHQQQHQQHQHQRRPAPLLVPVPRLDLQAVVKPPASTASGSSGNSSNGGGGRHTLFAKNLPSSDGPAPPIGEHTAREEAALCLLASPSLRPVHRAAPLQDRRSYVYPPAARQDGDATERLLARLPANGPAHRAVRSLWSSLRACRRDCEAMAARGVRVARDISRDWQETVSDLIDRVVAQDAELTALRGKVAAAEEAAAGAERAAREARHAQARAEAQVVQLKQQVHQGGAVLEDVVPVAAAAPCVPAKTAAAAGEAAAAAAAQDQQAAAVAAAAAAAASAAPAVAPCAQLALQQTPAELHAQVVRLKRQRDRLARDAADAAESARRSRDAIDGARADARSFAEALRAKARAVAADGAALLRRNEALEAELARVRRATAVALAAAATRTGRGGGAPSSPQPSPAARPPPAAAGRLSLDDVVDPPPRSPSVVQLRLPPGLGVRKSISVSMLPQDQRESCPSSPSKAGGGAAAAFEAAAAAAARRTGGGGGGGGVGGAAGGADAPSLPDSPLPDAEACRRRLQQLQMALQL